MAENIVHLSLSLITLPKSKLGNDNSFITLLFPIAYYKNYQCFLFFKAPKVYPTMNGKGDTRRVVEFNLC